ncbi:unnamed protein product [Auanema sp. JU1783]|nr:unnamed protein product [Auanema sp. JU1783]
MTRLIHSTETVRRLERSRSAARPRGAANAQTAKGQPYEITLAVLGASRVGKSALVSQFLWEGFPYDYRPTVEEFNWIEYETDEGGPHVMLQVIDSSGSRDFLAMRQLYIRTAHVFIVVFSVDDPDSFEEAKKIVDEILEIRQRKAPIILVANKRDLYENIENWKVHDSYNFAYSRMIPLFEVTAKERNEVLDAINDALERLRSSNGSGISVLRKRRQSMPSARAYSGIDATDIERLQQKHKAKANCTIS